MLFARAQSIPVRVEAQIGTGEQPIATLRGLLESGFALTHRRLFAWRGTGVIGPLPLQSIDAIVVETGQDGSHIGILVIPRDAVHPPLALAVRSLDGDKVDAFLERLARELGAGAARERFGPMLRVRAPRVWRPLSPEALTRAKPAASPGVDLS